MMGCARAEPPAPRPLTLSSASTDAETRAPLRYTDVKDVFAAHCFKCHHREQSDNDAAMRVFEASRYPFSTERPDTLLADLREMFVDRSGLTDAERDRALRWIDGGGRDAEGRAPVWIVGKPGG